MINVRDGFDAIAEQYDRQRRLLIPCFDDFYRVALSVLETSAAAPSVLDIGAGTGLFSAMLLERYPQARLTLIDLSEKMLNVARQRFADREPVEYIVGDYTQHGFSGPFDLIVSGLSIHHLDNGQKRNLFRKCHDLLVPGGTLVNADQALGDTPQTEAMYSRIWRRLVEQSGPDVPGGLSRDEIEKAYERTRLDRPSTLRQQLDWLREAGFAQVDCVYKYYHFTVFYAKKAGPTDR